jgi:hypothetical protein
MQAVWVALANTFSLVEVLLKLPHLFQTFGELPKGRDRTRKFFRFIFMLS